MVCRGPGTTCGGQLDKLAPLSYPLPPPPHNTHTSTIPSPGDRLSLSGNGEAHPTHTARPPADGTFSLISTSKLNAAHASHCDGGLQPSPPMSSAVWCIVSFHPGFLSPRLKGGRQTSSITHLPVDVPTLQAPPPSMKPAGGVLTKVPLTSMGWEDNLVCLTHCWAMSPAVTCQPSWHAYHHHPGREPLIQSIPPG